jgi:hypothetical protein
MLDFATLPHSRMFNDSNFETNSLSLFSISKKFLHLTIFIFLSFHKLA